MNSQLSRASLRKLQLQRLQLLARSGRPAQKEIVMDLNSHITTALQPVLHPALLGAPLAGPSPVLLPEPVDPDISTHPSQALVAKLLQPSLKPGGRQMLLFRVWIEVDDPQLLSYIPGDLVHQMEQDLERIVYHRGQHILPDWMHRIAFAELDETEFVPC